MVKQKDGHKFTCLTVVPGYNFYCEKCEFEHLPPLRPPPSGGCTDVMRLRCRVPDTIQTALFCTDCCRFIWLSAAAAIEAATITTATIAIFILPAVKISGVNNTKLKI